MVVREELVVVVAVIGLVVANTDIGIADIQGGVQVVVGGFVVTVVIKEGGVIEFAVLFYLAVAGIGNQQRYLR